MTTETFSPEEYDQFLLDAIMVKMAGMFDGAMVSLKMVGADYELRNTSDDSLLMVINGNMATLLRHDGAKVALRRAWLGILNDFENVSATEYLLRTSERIELINRLSVVFGLKPDVLKWSFGLEGDDV